VRNAPPKARSYHSATAVGHQMLVFGGNGASKSFKEVYFLDTETWSWSEPETTGELPKPRTGHTATASPDGRFVPAL
jgi:N-acetylneuraminic acid mutarotase